MKFLDEEWLAKAKSIVDGVSVSERGAHRIVLEHADDDLGQVVHSQIWRSGHLDAWVVGAISEPDAIVSIDLWAQYLWMLGRPAATASICVRDGHDRTWSLPPTPFEICRTASERMVKGLMLLACIEVPDHPFGLASVNLNVRDGLVGVNGIGESGTDAPVVKVVVPFRDASTFLLGGRPFRDIAARASVQGDLFSLGTLCGLLAPPAVLSRWNDAHLAVEHACGGLVAFGGVRRKLEELVGLTEAP